MTCVEIDPRVGGQYTITEQRDGTAAKHTGKYLEIERPNRLVYTLEDNIVFQHPAVIIEIAPKNSGCELTLAHQGVLSEYHEKVQDGWTKVFNGLASMLN